MNSLAPSPLPLSDAASRPVSQPSARQTKSKPPTVERKRAKAEEAAAAAAATAGDKLTRPQSARVQSHTERNAISSVSVVAAVPEDLRPQLADDLAAIAVANARAQRLPPRSEQRRPRTSAVDGADAALGDELRPAAPLGDAAAPTDVRSSVDSALPRPRPVGRRRTEVAVQRPEWVSVLDSSAAVGEQLHSLASNTIAAGRSPPRAKKAQTSSPLRSSRERALQSESANSPSKPAAMVAAVPVEDIPIGIPSVPLRL